MKEAKILLTEELLERIKAEIKSAREAKKDPWDKETRENWKEKMNS
jgi:hypothetical protein